ncbi:MAG: chemotaxis protein CheW, partial [Proteobacteria bacterium]|nr:chemotaxis protein CheW [Pseudomonadota bacterium]
MKKGDVKQGIDWAEVRRRVDRAQQALEREWRPTADEKARILKARAKAIAVESERGEAPGEVIEVVEMLLGEEHYGIESIHIREVYPLKTLTPLPCTPPFVLGIINVRGQILAVLDGKQFFELPPKGLSDQSKVIILRSSDMEFGILADAVIGVRSIPVSEIQPSLPMLTDIRETYLKGVTLERLIIIDAAKLLSDPRIIV